MRKKNPNVRQVILGAFFIVLFGCIDSQPDTGANHLANTSSPYLLQHANNPVDWYPWGDEAFEKAKQEDKPIIISIGYAACHWCHVMEHESFEDSVVAAYMNKHFVAIKVDREERPDVDQIYMNAAQLIIGRGGWPLNAFALPNGKPFYAATYFPKKEWMQLLKKIKRLYEDEKERVIESAENVTEGIRESELVSIERDTSGFSKLKMFDSFVALSNMIDTVEGGFIGSPKFPLPVAWEYLLQLGHLVDKEEVLDAVSLTLNEMAHGGIYDQLGGGFARYSVDDEWFVPHFEKMLYDNGQLISLYSKAYQAFQDPLYEEVVRETIDFVERDLSQGQGGFYSSLDADSEGEEGTYYVWKWEELEKLLNKDQLEFAKIYFHISPKGNWEEGKNILRAMHSADSQLTSKLKLSEEEISALQKEMERILLEARRQREKPGTDDKVLASWNALMCNGLVDAYRTFNNPEYLERAVNNAEFILRELSMKDGGLFRNYKDGKASIPGFLDDYAYWIQALTNLYQATFDKKWLEEAKRLNVYVNKNFTDQKSQMYYYTSDQGESLIARKMEISDNVTPASNSVMAKNLYRLGHFFDIQDWKDRSNQMLKNIEEGLIDGVTYYANWASLYAWFALNHYEVAIVGEHAIHKRSEMDQTYQPNVFYLGATQDSELPLLKQKYVEGNTIIYVCQNKVCMLPVDDTKAAMDLITFEQE